MTILTRRAFAASAALGPALLPDLARAAAAPALSPRFELRVRVGPAQELGEVGGGRRRVVPITGGEVVGERLNGVILPGGADWQTLRADGVTILQARYTLQARDGAVIGVINTGVRTAPAEVARRMAAGELVDPALYYFRASPVFEVGPGPHQWLTERLFVCAGERTPDLVRLTVYEVS